MSLRGNLPLNAQNFFHLTFYVKTISSNKVFFRVFGFKLTISDVHLIKRRCLVLLLTIDSTNTRCAILQSFERDFLPIDVNALTRDFTM